MERETCREDLLHVEQSALFRERRGIGYGQFTFLSRETYTVSTNFIPAYNSSLTVQVWVAVLSLLWREKGEKYRINRAQAGWLRAAIFDSQIAFTANFGY
jgi:hypothetical protein